MILSWVLAWFVPKLDQDNNLPNYPIIIEPLNTTTNSTQMHVTVPKSLIKSNKPCLNMRQLTQHPLDSSDDCAKIDGSEEDYVFFSFERPLYTFGDIGGQPAELWLDGSKLWSTRYIPKPVLDLKTVVMNNPVGVKIFVKPGWSQFLASGDCANCDRTLNRVAIKRAIAGTSACNNRAEQKNAFSDDLKEYHLNNSPFRFFVSDNNIDIWTGIDVTLNVDARRLLFARTWALCFYETPHAAVGTQVGQVVFELDQGDAEAFVFSVLFFFVLLPVLCAISWA